MGGSSTILKLLEYGAMGLHGKDRECLKRYVAALAVRYWEQTLALLRDQGIDIR